MLDGRAAREQLMHSTEREALAGEAGVELRDAERQARGE